MSDNKNAPERNAVDTDVPQWAYDELLLEQRNPKRCANCDLAYWWKDSASFCSVWCVGRFVSGAHAMTDNNKNEPDDVPCPDCAADTPESVPTKPTDAPDVVKRWRDAAQGPEQDDDFVSYMVDILIPAGNAVAEELEAMPGYKALYESSNDWLLQSRAEIAKLREQAEQHAMETRWSGAKPLREYVKRTNAEIAKLRKRIEDLEAERR